MKHLESAFKGTNEWWKYLVLIIGSLLVANIIGAIPLGIAVLVATIKNGASPEMVSGMDFAAMGINSTLGLGLMIFPFLVGLVFFVLLFKPLHKKVYQTTINGTSTIRWRRIIIGFVVWGLISSFFIVVDYFLNINDYELRFNLKALIPLAIVSILLIPFQTFYEEILFRGYLAQGIGRLTQNRLLVILIPSIFFALMHAVNPEIEKYGFWAMMPQYFTIAVFYGLIAVFDDGIELVMGAHAANNVFLSIFVTADGTVFQTDALLKALEIDPAKEYVTLLIACIVFIGTLAFKYRWSFKTLVTPIEPEGAND